MTDIRWWLTNVDWRISTGVIFSLILLLYGRGTKRRCFWLRAALGCMVLCASSWGMRYAIEEWLGNAGVWQTIGYSLFLLLMSCLYLLCHSFCRRSSSSDLWFNGTVAVTVYRIAWDALKVITSTLIFSGVEWSVLSGKHLLLSYGAYVLVILPCALLYRLVVKEKNRMPGHFMCLLWFGLSY